MPRKMKDAPAQAGGGIKAFFNSTTPLKDISNSTPAPPTIAATVRAKTAVVRNLKLQQIQGGAAGIGGRAAQMPGSPPGEDEVLHSGTCVFPSPFFGALSTHATRHCPLPTAHLPISWALCEALCELLQLDCLCPLAHFRRFVPFMHLTFIARRRRPGRRRGARRR